MLSNQSNTSLRAQASSTSSYLSIRCFCYNRNPGHLASQRGTLHERRLSVWTLTGCRCRMALTARAQHASVWQNLCRNDAAASSHGVQARVAIIYMMCRKVKVTEERGSAQARTTPYTKLAKTKRKTVL
jgi:hypothetical protein